MKNLINSVRKYAILLFCCCGINSLVAQKNYYISASGNDANSGTSINSPWKTINRVNRQSLNNGDIINFKRGDVFYGSLDVKGKNGSFAKRIQYDAYGSGNRPIIRAAKSLKNWSRFRGDIWRIPLNKVDGNRITALYLNNVSQQIGREPNYNATNGGYRTISSHSNNNRSISESSALPYATNFFKGGEITIRTTDDSIKSEIITSHSGKTVNFQLSSSNGFVNNIENNFGYFFQNHVNTLDMNGEWAHDIVNGVLYLYSEVNPNTINVEIPLGAYAISLKNSSNINFKNIKFEGGNDVVLSINKANNITIDNCELNNGSNYLGLGFGLKNFKFTNSTIQNGNNIGIRFEQCNGITFSNNLVRNVGTRSGMGASSFVPYTGVRIISENGSAKNIIEKNVVNKIGYHGINYSGGNFEIRFNYVRNFCLTKDDGGGIYTVGNKNANNRIYKNVVTDGIGAALGAPNNRGPKTAGIYIDNDSQNQLIYENSVSNVIGWGLMANLSSKSTFRDNLVYNCGTAIVSSTYFNSFAAGGGVARATNNTFVNNIFFPKKANQLCAEFTNRITASGFNTFLGEVNKNYYCQPFNGAKQIETFLVRNKTQHTLSEFKIAFPNYEKNGKNAPIQYPSSTDANSIIKFEINATGTSKTINLGNIKYVDAKNIEYTGNVAIPPYSSIALLKKEKVNTPTQLINDGVYFLESVTSDQRLQSEPYNNHLAIMFNPFFRKNQMWAFTHLGNNVYTLKNEKTGRYLEVPFAKCENGTAVSTYTSATGNHQRWKVVKNGNDYSLMPAHCMSQGLDRNQGTLNTNIITYVFSENNNNQKWKIQPISSNRKLAQDEIDDKSIKIYPNPVTNVLTFTGKVIGEKVRIYSISGVKVKELTLENSSIPVNDLASGMYLVSIKDSVIKLMVL
ncbi:RICIN domain-containing protein [Tenacibaculum jejuense]|uniref:Uncharacterized protein n=1 Tax=Tenacibaculum jejuense TaxID=584609 RepID=A0A238UAG8_9FLAO|nr:RICIN domain-containing protein [Tenacibaculum jejuense]SNR15568.1 Protein of unknown function precursor containing a C-terminal secretion signal [Tenacibaculum jejuense]